MFPEGMSSIRGVPTRAQAPKKDKPSLNLHFWVNSWSIELGNHNLTESIKEAITSFDQKSKYEQVL